MGCLTEWHLSVPPPDPASASASAFHGMTLLLCYISLARRWLMRETSNNSVFLLPTSGHCRAAYGEGAVDLKNSTRFVRGKTTEASGEKGRREEYCCMDFIDGGCLSGWKRADGDTF